MLASALLLVLAVQAPADPDFRQGTWLFSACKGAVRWMDAAEGSKPENDLSNFNNCSSYIYGFFDAEQLFNNCTIPEGVTMETFIRVYVLYMEQHPKLLDDNRYLGLQKALLNTYACKRLDIPSHGPKH